MKDVIYCAVCFLSNTGLFSTEKLHDLVADILFLRDAILYELNTKSSLTVESSSLLKYCSTGRPHFVCPLTFFQKFEFHEISQF